MQLVLLSPPAKFSPHSPGAVYTFPLVCLLQPEVDGAGLVGWRTAMFSFARVGRPLGPAYDWWLIGPDLVSSMPHTVLRS